MGVRIESIVLYDAMESSYEFSKQYSLFFPKNITLSINVNISVDFFQKLELGFNRVPQLYELKVTHFSQLIFGIFGYDSSFPISNYKTCLLCNNWSRGKL